MTCPVTRMAIPARVLMIMCNGCTNMSSPMRIMTWSLSVILWGGGIALLYGLLYPEEVRGLVCVGSGARLRVHPMFLEGLEKAIAAEESTQAFAESALSLVDPELAGTIARRMEENGLAAMLNDLRACDKFDIMDRLAEIDIPLLAISATDDVMTPPKYSQYLADHMQNARAVTIEGGTHFVFAEKPEEVNRAIEDFLKAL